MAELAANKELEEVAEDSGIGATPTPLPVESKRVRFHGLITLSVMAATIMQALDTTIANVALPRMQGTLSATQDEMGWVLTSYIVAAAITIPLTGWLAGQFGRRRVFLISIFVFAVGPALGGWLTENYSWRWVFYINLPIGILAFAGLYLTMPENRNAQGSRFDFLGFGSLAIAIASLQVLLDRGQLLDWFSSREIIIEAFAAG